MKIYNLLGPFICFASWNKCFFLFCLSRFIKIITTRMIANSHHTYRGCTAILVGYFNGKGISYYIWYFPLTQGLETASGILELARQIIAQLPLSAKTINAVPKTHRGSMTPYGDFRFSIGPGNGCSCHYLNYCENIVICNLGKKLE